MIAHRARAGEAFRGRAAAVLRVGILLAAGALPAAARPESPKKLREAPAGGVCSAQEQLALAESGGYESFSQLQQSVTALAGGGFAAVWEEGDYPAKEVRMQWFDAAGRARFPPGGTVVAPGPDDYSSSVMAPEAAGGAHVAFQVGPTVLVQRFDALGQAQWPGRGVEVVRRPSDVLVLFPYLVPASGGGVFVCFQHWSSGPVLDIRCQLLDGSGNRRWSDYGLSACAGGNADLRVLPRAVSDGAGGLLVFWRNQRNVYVLNPGPMLMEGQHFASDGRLLWEAPKVVRTTGLPADNSHSFRFFQVVPDGAGGAVLAFSDWITAPDVALDVIAQRVSGDGDLLWGTGAVVTGALGQQQHDQTIASGDGGAFVVVMEFVHSNHNRLVVYRLGPGGQHVWGASGVVLSEPGATGLDYFASGSFDGGVLRLGWTTQAAPFTFEMDTAIASYGGNGARLGNWFFGAPDGQFLAGGLAWSAGSGGLLAAWDDRRKGTWEDVDVGAGLLKENGACRTGLYFTLAPCRLLDTRQPARLLLASQAGTVEAAGQCGVPASAAALALNVTVVGPAADGHLTLFPANHFRPFASALTFREGQTRANNLIAPLSLGGGFSFFPFLNAGGTMHLLVDVNGYFE